MVHFGCSKNLVDSEVILGLLAQADFVITPFNRNGRCDVLVVNTCGFIQDAVQEAIDFILEAASTKGENRARALVVVGCLAQRYGPELMTEIPEIDAVIGTGNVQNIVTVLRTVLSGQSTLAVNEPSYLYSHESPRLLTTKPYAYVKIAEGCDNWCSYCTVPAIRGKYRSRPVASIVQEVQSLAASGVKEHILIAQDTTQYGKNLDSDQNLACLLEKLCGSTGDGWIRWLYGYPSAVDVHILEIMASNEIICNYLDIPIQHVDTQILRNMRRTYDENSLRKLLDRIQRHLPGATLRTSLMVGFPGEDDKKFNKLLAFIEEAEFDRVGVFTYSAEEGTEASQFAAQLPAEIKNERRNILMQAQQLISLRKNRRRIGKIERVMIESTFAEKVFARSQAEAPEVDGKIEIVPPSAADTFVPGDFVKVRIIEAGPYDLIGEIVA